MSTPQQRSDFVSKTRQQATKLLDTVAEMDALYKDYSYMGLGSELTEEDCQGLTVEAIQAVYTSLAAINNLLGAGHGTNLATVRVG